MPVPCLSNHGYYNVKHWVAVCLLLVGALAGFAQADVLNHRNQQEVLQFLSKNPLEASNGKQRFVFNELITKLIPKRVVMVGEIHDRYDHHLNQLAILKALYEKDPKIGLGVEWFQQPFQPVLDAYLAGRIDEAEMLRRSGYYDRWRYDYRMLRPILTFAKDNKIPVLALNAPVEITQKVAQGGLDSLTDAERKQLPAQITPAPSSYLQRLRRIFMAHGHGASEERFENFALVQRIWDETMAANALEFLQANPRSRLVIFMGSGHMSDHMGVPNDLMRTLPAGEIATLITNSGGDMQIGQFDYYLLGQPHSLIPTGRLGAWFEPDSRGLRINKLSVNSAATQAGIMVGDRVLKINEVSIKTLGDLLALLSNYTVGQSINVTIERNRLIPKSEKAPNDTTVVLTMTVKLQ